MRDLREQLELCELDSGTSRLLSADVAEWEELLAAADMLCRLERRIAENQNNKPWPVLLQLEHELEAARREQAREGGSDGK